MLVIYTERYTPRVRYIFEHIFKSILQQEIVILKKRSELADYPDSPVLCYSSTERVENALHIRPHVLLFMTGVREYPIDMLEWQGLPAFFATGDATSDVPFDMFAAAFYLLSRYEEYLPGAMTEDGCFPAERSLAYKQGFLNRPLVDEWAQALEKLWAAKDARYRIQHRKFCFRPMIAVTQQYKYRKRSWGTTLRKMLTKFKQHRLRDYIRILLHLQDDPYDNTSSLISVHLQQNLIPTFFVLIRHGSTKDSPNRSINLAPLRRLLRRNFIIGLMYSYDSFLSLPGMKKEREVFMKGIHPDGDMHVCIHRSRLYLPDSYRMVRKLSAREDFSMSYSTTCGFRASTCTPFHFYNLQKERVSRLHVHNVPITFHALNSSGCSSEEMDTLLRSYAGKVKRVGGEYVTLFSNVSLSGMGRFYHWKSVYVSALRYISLLEVNTEDTAKEKAR